MNRLMRTVAVGGSISLISLMGLSLAGESPWADLDEESPPPAAATARPPVAKSPSPGRRIPVREETAPRNYYQELFATGSAGEKTPVSRPKPTAAKSASNRSAKKPVPVRAAKLDPVSSESGELEPGDWAEVDASPVVKANHDQPAEAEPQGTIQQVRIETRPRTPRIPVPPNRQRSAPMTAKQVSHAPEATAPLSTSAAGPLASAVSLEWVKKSEFNVGQECSAELVVKNTGSSPVDQVAVDAIFQSPVRLVSVKPQPVEGRDRLSWSFDTLPPGAEHRIALKLIPARRGDLDLQAQVRLTGSAASTFRVEEPMLKVALKGSNEVMLGDSTSQMVVVSNPGTGAAQDVKLVAKVTAGLEHARGERDAIEMEIGTIMPGEQRTIRLPLTSVKGGAQTVSVTASSNAEASNVATANINVISPSLTISADGPALRYKGRNAKFTANVTNDGSVANNNVRVVQAVSEGFQFVAADHGGKYDPAHKTVTWFLGRLEPDQSIQVSCELTAVALGDFTQRISVASDAGARAETTHDTQIDGAAALTMEIVDLDDPVEVGVETAYEIRVKNSGSKAATNVAVSCELPAGVQLLTAKGPTDAAAEGRTLSFTPLAQVAPGQECVFRVHVKGTQDGNQRVKARVSSDSLTDPLLKEEPTKFYADARR